MEDPEDYYDMDDDYDGDSHENPERTAYPPRLMVDFNSLAMNTLLRYAQFYQITVRDGTDKAHLAAVVARHFDGTLDVEEDESIVSFMQRIRNGEKSVVRHRPPEKDRSSKHKDKARKKSTSTSRKRPRDASVVGGKDASANGSSDHVKHADIDASPSRSKPSSGSGSGSAGSGGSGSGGSGSGGSGSGNSGSGNSGSSDKSKSTSSHKKTDAKKKSNDNGEDNELYCICNLPSYGNMIACDGKNCPNPSQWYHLECVGFSDGRHPDTWLCPECDPKGFADFKSKKKKHAKQRSKSPGSK